MHYYDIKFLLDFENYDCSIIKSVFNNLRSALNWQFDENLNANLIDGDIDYQVRDVSNLERDEIDKIIESFFIFNFDDIINVPLYRFLVLKNNNQLKILAHVSSLIFDYSSINDFYELFDDLNKNKYFNNLIKTCIPLPYQSINHMYITIPTQKFGTSYIRTCLTYFAAKS